MNMSEMGKPTCLIMLITL